MPYDNHDFGMKKSGSKYKDTSGHGKGYGSKMSGQGHTGRFDKSMSKAFGAANKAADYRDHHKSPGKKGG